MIAATIQMNRTVSIRIAIVPNPRDHVPTGCVFTNPNSVTELMTVKTILTNYFVMWSAILRPNLSVILRHIVFINAGSVMGKGTVPMAAMSKIVQNLIVLRYVQITLITCRIALIYTSS